MTKTSAWYAERYAGRFGMALVPIEPRRKFPTADDWGKNVITDEAAAATFWTENPEWNIGLALGPSRFCSLDIAHAISDLFHSNLSHVRSCRVDGPCSGLQQIVPQHLVLAQEA